MGQIDPVCTFGVKTNGEPRNRQPAPTHAPHGLLPRCERRRAGSLISLPPGLGVSGDRWAVRRSAAASPFQDGLERTGRRRPSDRIASATGRVMAAPTAIAALVSGRATYTNKPSSATGQGGAERTGGVSGTFRISAVRTYSDGVEAAHLAEDPCRLSAGKSRCDQFGDDVGVTISRVALAATRRRLPAGPERADQTVHVRDRHCQLGVPDQPERIDRWHTLAERE